MCPSNFTALNTDTPENAVIYVDLKSCLNNMCLRHSWCSDCKKCRNTTLHITSRQNGCVGVSLSGCATTTSRLLGLQDWKMELSVFHKDEQAAQFFWFVHFCYHCSAGFRFFPLQDGYENLPRSQVIEDRVETFTDTQANISEDSQPPSD